MSDVYTHDVSDTRWWSEFLWEEMIEDKIREESSSLVLFPLNHDMHQMHHMLMKKEVGTRLIFTV